MKANKKPKGTKARVQASKRRLSYIGTAITVAIFIAIIAISSFLVYSFPNPSPNQTINSDQTSNQPSKPKAAIVDQLSLTAPNQTFIETATTTLEQAGYTVDYYKGEKVTVEFYRNLPMYGYSLIILRVHSALSAHNAIGLFSSERYSKSKYIYEQLSDQVIPAVYSDEDQQRGIIYFGISPLFVKQRMNGRFQNTTIILMGCEGLVNPTMAEAFVQRGAKVYISWNGPISASHTDLATTHLLQHSLIEKRTLKESVRETFKEAGFDPAYKSLLIYYPLEVGDQTVEDNTGNPRTNP